LPSTIDRPLHGALDQRTPGRLMAGSERRNYRPVICICAKSIMPVHMRLRHVAERNMQIAQNSVHFLLGLKFLGFTHQLARQVGGQQLDELIHVGA